MTTSGSNNRDVFWRGAAGGLVVATVFACALTGTFYGTGLPKIVEAFFGGIAGAVCLYVFVMIARWLPRVPRFAPPEFFIVAIAAIATFIVLRNTRFRWNPMLFYPAVLVFLAAQATLAGSFWAWFRNDANRTTLAALMGVALIVDVAGIVWLAYGGRDPYPVELSSAREDPSPLDLPNPAKPGRFDVEALTYGSGTDIRRPEFGDGVTLESRTIDASKMLPEWKDFKARARKWYWGFSIEKAPLNARVWLPVGDGPFPLVLVVHGNHRMEDHSDPGYAYLGELFASRGFITASVDENFINGTWSGDFRGKEMPLRAWLLLEHLRLWHEWNAAEGHRFQGKVDLDKIALIGHSRGGEAVSVAYLFNELSHYPGDATVRFDYGYSIRALVAIAQTDRHYPHRVKLENVDFLALQGSYDSDESSSFGVRQSRRIRFTEDAYHFKAGIYIHGANHGQFNTTWGMDSGLPSLWLLNRRPLLPGEDQRQVAKVYIAGFLEASLRDDRRYLPLFRDPRVASHWLPDEVIYVQHFDDSTSQLVADFEEDLDVTTGSLEGTTIDAEGVSLWREDELRFRDNQTQSTHATVVGWSAAGATYTIGFDPKQLELDDGAMLSFFLTRSTESPVDEAKAEDVPLQLSVELLDAGGSSADVRLRDIAPVTPPLKVQFLKIKRLNRAKTWEPTPQSYEIPLSRFDAVDRTRLKAIRFRFESSRGVVILDDIGFRGTPLDIEPGEQ